METDSKLKRMKQPLTLFMIALFISGITAIPVDAQLSVVVKSVKPETAFHTWMQKVLLGCRDVSNNYPFLFYGYNWLAFAHFVLALLFIGPYKDTVKNIGVIQFGLIACVLVIPFALAAGHFRGIPIVWRLIDGAFGVVGFALLGFIYSKAKLLMFAPVIDNSPSTILQSQTA